MMCVRASVAIIAIIFVLVGRAGPESGRESGRADGRTGERAVQRRRPDFSYHQEEMYIVSDDIRPGRRAGCCRSAAVAVTAAAAAATATAAVTTAIVDDADDDSDDDTDCLTRRANALYEPSVVSRRSLWSAVAPMPSSILPQ